MNGQSEVADLLRAMPMFADTDASVLSEIQAIAKIVDIPKGTLVFAEGDTHTDLYFVSSGTIVLDMITAQCGKQTILTLGEGDVLAWSAFLSDSRMTASAVASEDSRLIALPTDQLRTLCETNHDVGYVVALGVAKLISRRLLATRLQLLDLFHT